MADVDNRKWGWQDDGGDQAYGPFDSKDEAIVSAQEMFEGDCAGEYRTIYIGRCDPFDPGYYAAHVADYDRNLLDDMEEAANDECGGLDFTIFNIRSKDRKEAKAAFETMMKAWAKAYVYSDGWMLVSAKEETIYIPSDEESLCPSCNGNGTKLREDLGGTDPCSNCKGKGYVEDFVKDECPWCEGEGVSKDDEGYILNCRECGGKGYFKREMADKKCKFCRGTGYVRPPKGVVTGFECPECHPLTEGEKQLAEALGCPAVEDEDE